MEWTPDNWAEAQRIAKCNARTTLVVYRTDAVVKRSFNSGNLPDNPLRGKVGEAPSKASLNNLIFLLNNSDRPFVSMFTFTMTPRVNRVHSVREHKNALKAALQKLRRSGVGQYCWVREYQENNSIHWHVFTDLVIDEPGNVNAGLSRSWSRWFATYYKRLCGNADDYKKMTSVVLSGTGNCRDDFYGCVRCDQLESDAAGRYAGKEGGKRFQKRPPAKWKRGGAWWDSSRGITCTPVKTVQVPTATIKTRTVKTHDGEIEVAFKLQYARGLIENDE